MKVCDTDHGLPGWERWEVLHLAALLQKVPEAERPAAVVLVKGSAAPPTAALAALGNLVGLAAASRKMVYRLAASEDPDERRKALALAAALPHPVDPGLVAFRKTVYLAQKAARLCRAPEFKSRLSTLAEDAAVLLKDMEKARRATS